MTPEHTALVATVERVAGEQKLYRTETIAELKAAATLLREQAGEIERYQKASALTKEFIDVAYAVKAERDTLRAELEAAHRANLAGLNELETEVAALKREIEVLRQYGNKDCTHMADAALADKQEPV
jgi:hypothetical protein